MAGIDRAVSMQQPYAEQILRGELAHTRRSRPLRSLKERVYLYASDRPAPKQEWDEAGIPFNSLPTRQIIGTVRVVGCEETSNGYLWLFAAPERLRETPEFDGRPGPGIWRPRVR